MAKVQDGRDQEIAALLQVEGADSAKIQEQIEKRSGTETATPPATPPAIPPATPPAATPSGAPPAQPVNVPNPETIRSAMLNEMFGEQFKTVEDFKKAHISESLQELTTLRQKNQELDALVKARPKHQFANDNIAKFNEFVRETKIDDAVIFNRINGADVANMNDLDALSLQHIIDNPHLASKTPQEIRRYFERKYNVDVAKVEAGDLTQEELDFNLMDLSSEGAKAKAKLQDLKSKIKMPEPVADEPPQGKTKWTPEIEKSQKAAWNEKMGGGFEKIAIPMKGSTVPIIEFTVPEDSNKSIIGKALDYIVGNRMEATKENVDNIAWMMYSDVVATNLDQITQAVSERVRSMTADEFLKTYHNPSPKNNDAPPVVNEPLSDEAKRKKAFEGEMSR